MSEKAIERPVIELARPLRRSRLATQLIMMAERAWPLVLPLLIVVSLFLSAAWFGLFRWLPDQPRLGLLAILAVGALGALTLFRHFRLPGRREIDTRIENANLLEHTPLRVQDEQPGGKADIFADALWREHQRRMAGKLRNLTSDLPRPNIPNFDRWGLRSVVALLTVTAFAFSFGSSGGRLSDAFRPAAATMAEPPRIDAWVTPPSYTGKAPIFLTAEANRGTRSFTLPEGSELTMRVTGGSGDETLSYLLGGNERLIEPKDAEENKSAADGKPEAPKPKSGNQQFAVKLGDNGAVLLRQGEGELARWDFNIVPDKPPTIRFSEEPRRAVNGTLELRYQVDDDYGAASGTGDIELIDQPKAGARPLFQKPELKLAMPRRGANPPVGRVTPDLTEHVWAGVPIALTLTAVDAAGQEAKSEVKKFILPERSFTNPLARAVIEMRRIIGLDANRKPWARELLDAITLRPEDTIQTPAHYVALMSLRTRMEMAGTDDQLREVVAYMWQIAIGIEDGELSDAEKRLKQAQEALKEALERGASDEEIDKLMKELRQAMNEYLREFAERAQRNQNAQQEQMPMDGQMLTQQDLQKMLDAIEQQARSGNREQAQAMLEELQNLMNNLQAGRQQQQQGDQGQQSQMRQQMNKLGELMRRQQEMMNETHRLEQQRRRGQQGESDQRSQQEGQQGQGEQRGQGEQGRQGQGNRPMTEEEFAEAMRSLQEGQGKLQKDLEALQESLRGMGLQPGKGFGEAGDQMGEAQGALGQQQGDQATGHQGQALEALRRGAQDMMQQMQQAMEGDQGGSEDRGARQRSADRDPLGRQQRNDGGLDDGQTTQVPDEVDAQRARQILDAIRKRLGNALSPELERSYLERLLEMQ